MMQDILREQYGIDLYRFGKHTKPLHECQAAVYELYDRRRAAQDDFYENAVEFQDTNTYGECTFKPEFCKNS